MINRCGHNIQFILFAAPPDPPRMWRYITWTGKWLYVWWDHIQYDWFGNISFPLYYKVCLESFKFATVFIFHWIRPEGKFTIIIMVFWFQVMFRKTGYIYGKVYITGWHFMDFPMPQVGDYELMVRGRYEGGDGPIRKIRIQGKSN